MISEFKLWEDYLNFINNISIENTILACYTLNNNRTKLHEKLNSYYLENIKNFDTERFRDFTDNLDILIDFNPPLIKSDSIKVYVRKMIRWLNITEGMLFLTKKTYRVEGVNGYLDASAIKK